MTAVLPNLDSRRAALRRALGAGYRPCSRDVTSMGLALAEFQLRRTTLDWCLLLILPALLSSCGLAPILYQGDGHLSVTLEDGTYIVHLARIDLSKAGMYRFEMSNLPEKTFTLGFAISRKPGDQVPLIEQKPTHAYASLRLTNERGEVVMLVADVLSDWTWGGATAPGFNDDAFVYHDGPLHKVQWPSGTTSYECYGTRPDYGWGTYFVPRPGAHYFVQLAITGEAAGSAQLDVRLEARGGGWKGLMTPACTRFYG